MAELELIELTWKINLDGIYITNLTNIKYLTGFTGSAGALLVLEEKQYYFSDTRYNVQSKEQEDIAAKNIVDNALENVPIWGTNHTVGGDDYLKF